MPHWNKENNNKDVMVQSVTKNVIGYKKCFWQKGLPTPIVFALHITNKKKPLTTMVK